MNSLIWFMFAALAIVVVQSKRLDPGPQTFIDKTPAVQNPQKRYATKEVVVYLTPSQIKAIQEGKGFISAEPADQAEPAEETEQETEEQQPEQDDLFELSPKELEQSQAAEEEEDQAAPTIPVEEPTSEQIEDDPQFAWLFRQDDKNFVPSPEDPYAYLRYYPETETQTEQAQSAETEEEVEEETEEAQPETQQDQEQQQRFRLVPFESASEKPAPSTTKAPQEEPIRERWLRLLELNRSQLRKQLASQQSTTTTTTEQPRPDGETTLGRFRFSARYNDQRQAIENEERRKVQLEKLRANIRAEGRGNRAPFVIRKDGTIARQRQSSLVKHVKVPTPVLVPIPEPFEVKVPHPFPVPLEIFRPLANQSGKSKKGEAKKAAAAARIENERPRTTTTRRPTTTTTTTTTTERPSAPERRVASDNRKEVTVEVPTRQRGQPERITIIRHIWDK